ncbi:unnamed protein product [Symbiodinium sp. CCMP2456]|nr:unnamed protein product [Symbiodinium sp. CCMP2456]
MEVALWYDRQMKVRPLCTKALSSSFLAACSCALAQALRRRASLRELASFTLQAAPPLGHLWFELLEAKLGPGRILVKTMVDQALFRPVMLLYTFVLGGLLSGQSWAEVRRNVRQNLVQANRSFRLSKSKSSSQGSVSSFRGARGLLEGHSGERSPDSSQ